MKQTKKGRILFTSQLNKSEKSENNKFHTPSPPQTNNNFNEGNYQKFLEIEKENFELKNKIKENELIIFNYKYFLNNKTLINNKNISTQTENYNQNNQREENERNESERNSERRGSESEERNNEIIIERNKHKDEGNEEKVEEIKDNNNFNNNFNNNSELNLLRNENIELNKEINFLKNNLLELSTNHLNIENKYKLRINKLEKKLQSIKSISKKKKKKILDCKIQHQQDKEQISIEFNEFQSHFQQSFQSILQKISLFEFKSNQQQHHSSHSNSLPSTNSISSLPSSNSLKSISIQSPIKLPSNSIISTSPSSSSSSSSSQLLLKKSQPLSPIKVESGNNPITPIKTNSIGFSTNLENDQSQQTLTLHELQLQIQQKDSTITKFSEYLQLISQSFRELQTISVNEINSLKHLSHCKELVRIASMRELGLERDRLTNELKYSS